MEKEASVLERDHVHNVYEKIAPYFSDARYKAWPKVQQFLLAQEPGSLIADIGCGNGKYLHINSQAFKLGCDYCFPLAESARNQGYEIMVCDGLCLPYRNECFDAVLSIAVIHHFSTRERRIRAVKEMARILRTGGHIMIYVWAMEQTRRKFEKQDIFVPWNPVPPSLSKASSHAINKPMSQKHRKVTVNQHSSSMDSATEAQKKSASFVGEKETFYTSFEKSLSWSFSKSFDSVLDLGASNSCGSNYHHTNEQSIFHNCSIQFNKEKLFDQTEPVMSTRHRQNSDYDALGVKEPLLSYHCSGLSSVENTTKHPAPKEVIHDCSRVSLPDLVSRHKGLPVRKQLENNLPPKQVDSYGRLIKGKTELSLQKTGNSHGIPVWQNQEETNPDGACLRYYHVFRKGELIEMIERYIPELHVVQAYFDHANWCVVAEKVQVWKI